MNRQLTLTGTCEVTQMQWHDAVDWRDSGYRITGERETKTRLVIKPIDGDHIKVLAWEHSADTDDVEGERITHSVMFEDDAHYEVGKDNSGKEYEYLSWWGKYHPWYQKSDRFSLQSWDNWKTIYPSLSYMPKFGRNKYQSGSYIVDVESVLLGHIVLDDKSQLALAELAEQAKQARSKQDA